MTEKLIDCAICEHHYIVTRDHCPACGAKLFVEGEKLIYRDVNRMQCELVRAFRSNIAYRFIAC